VGSDHSGKWGFGGVGLFSCPSIPLISFENCYFLSGLPDIHHLCVQEKRILLMATILVTGGSGYIGSHTIVDLIDHGFNVISVDNNSRSNPAMLEGIEKITGKK
jgi:hypothetical protein